jgi:hypothetical protein
MVGSLKMNTALEYSTRVVQEGDRRCKKSTLNDLAYLTPLRIPLMNPVLLRIRAEQLNTNQLRERVLECVSSYPRPHHFLMLAHFLRHSPKYFLFFCITPFLHNYTYERGIK